MITYSDYPTLLFLSYTKDDAPNDLPFEVASLQDKAFLAKSKGFNEMFGAMASFNSLGKKPTHFWLENDQFDKVENNDAFRNKHFSAFLKNLPAREQYGTICFKDGGQYVYFYLPAGMSKIVGQDRPYFATALFKGNFFIGFEEAIIADQGIQVLDTGNYGPIGMDRGGFLSFIFISLGFVNTEKTDLLATEKNSTSENVHAVLASRKTGNIVKYEVGSTFPKKNPNPGNDFSVAELNTAFFDIICYLNKPSAEEIKFFKKGKLRYGVFQQDNIPFFLVDLPEAAWNFDVSINILKIKNDRDLDAWLNAEGKTITLYLVDAISNILHGMRTISILTDRAERIRDILEVQSGSYTTPQEVNEKIARIEMQNTTAAMINATQMVNLSGTK